MSFNSGMKGADVVALLKNGLPIVDDVNKLDPNAELGSMASVISAGSIQETSIRNLYQPDENMIDYNTGILTAPELLSSVSSIKVFAPTDIDNIGFEPVSSGFYLVPRDFSMTNANMVMVQVADGNVFAFAMNDGMGIQQEFVLVEYSPDTDSFIVHDDQVEAFNAILANGMDWCYLGDPQEGFVITEEQFNTIDLFVNAVVGMPSITDIYVKGDSWERLYANELAELNATTTNLKTGVNDLQTQVSTIKTAYPIVYNSSSNILMQPNTYYKCSAYNNLTLTFDTSRDTDGVREYVIEVYCQNTFALSLPSTVKWANNTIPEIEAGKTIVISVVNNLAVFAEFM